MWFSPAWEGPSFVIERLPGYSQIYGGSGIEHTACPVEAVGEAGSRVMPWISHPPGFQYEILHGWMAGLFTGPSG